VKGNYFLNPWEWHQTHGFCKGKHYYSDEIIGFSFVNGFDIISSSINVHDDFNVDWQWVLIRNFSVKAKFTFSFEKIIMNFVNFHDIFLIFLRVGGGGLRCVMVPVRCTVVNHGKKALKFMFVSACCSLLLPRCLRIP
jgi:hypothetical protein